MTAPAWDHDEIERMLTDLALTLEEKKDKKVREFGWYAEHLPAAAQDFDYDEYRSADHYLAAAALPHPDLHPLMVRIVRRLTEVEEVWVDDEEHAGTGFAVTLALHDAAYVPLYAEFLTTNDLNHEVYQSEDIEEVVDRWGWGPATYPLFWARMFSPGQHYMEDFHGFTAGGLPEKLRDPAQSEAFFEAVKVLNFRRGPVAYMFDDDRIVGLFAELLPERDEAFARAFFDLADAGPDGYVLPVTPERIEQEAARRRAAVPPADDDAEPGPDPDEDR